MRWQLGEYKKHSDLRFNLQTPDPDLIIDRERRAVLFRIFRKRSPT
jgi:hypothetical protein